MDFKWLGSDYQWIRKPVSIWCDHHLPHAAWHICFEWSWSGYWFWPVLMLSDSSSMAVWSYWILAGTGTRCRTSQSGASQTCLMGVISGEYVGHGRTGTFSASRNCVQIIVTWRRALSCWNIKWCRRKNGTSMGLRILSRCVCIQIAIDYNAIVFVVRGLCLPIP